MGNETPQTSNSQMESHAPKWAGKLLERVKVLEERIAFFEHGNDSLSEMEVEMGKRIQRLEFENQQLISEVRRLRECLRDPFNPQFEKPPHY